MSQPTNCDQAAQDAAMVEIQGILAALNNRRPSTDMEVETALRMLGYNPKTVTAFGLCTCIIDGFYKKEDIPKHERDLSRDCLRSTVAGQAGYYLGLITDPELQDYLWSRSGTMTNVNYQPVLLREIIAYLDKRDAGRKARREFQEARIAAKQERRRKAAATVAKRSHARSTAFADACVADEEGASFVETEDSYAYERKVNRIVAKYKITGTDAFHCLLNLMALPDSHPAKRELFCETD